MIKKFNVNKIQHLDKINCLLSLFYRKPNQVEKIQLSEVRNIIIVDFALIGDMFMNIPFLRIIKQNCPKATISFVGMPWAEVVLGDQGLVDQFYVFDGKNILSNPISLIKNLKTVRKSLKLINNKEYDIAIEPKGDLRHTLFMHYIKCRRTITYNYTGGEYLVTDSFVPIEETKHLIDEKVDLLRLAGFKIENVDLIPTYSLSEELKEYVKNFRKSIASENIKLIGIHPGASNVNKQYRYYPDVVKRIKERYGNQYKFIVFSAKGEEEIVQSVCNVLNEEEYVEVKRSLKEYISLVSMCDYMICNDSAAGHIAASYGIPTLVIFGPVKAETASPRGKGRVITISKDLDCKPCTLSICPLGTEKCIKSVGISEVLNGFEELL